MKRFAIALLLFGLLTALASAQPVAGAACTGGLNDKPVLALNGSSTYVCAGGVWTLLPATLSTYTDGYLFISPADCSMTAGTTAFTTGPALVRTAANQQVLSGTTNTTAGTVTVTCNINVPTRTAGATKGVVLVDVSLLYGDQTTALASIAAATFSSVTYGSAGAAAQGTVAAAGGTLTVTPGTLQLTTTTAGQCFNEKIAFGTQIAYSDLLGYTLEQAFTTAGTTATTLQVCGVLLHFKGNLLS